jgi:D-sedoheptulose 7-phosphate isomerase
MSIELPDTAIILAGGLGLRLRPAVADRPKVLAPAGGRPFLDYLLIYLSSQGIRQVILSVGYLAEQVLDFTGDGNLWGLTITNVSEPTPLGTGGAIKLASQGLQTAFFALNGDTLFQVNLLDLWRFHVARRALATISLRKTPLDTGEQNQRGFIHLNEQGMIVSFSEKPGMTSPSRVDLPVSNELTEAGSLLTNGGVYILTPDALASLEPGQPASLEQVIFPKLAASGQLAGCPQSGYFIDIGTPQSLARFEKDLLASMDQPGMTSQKIYANEAFIKSQFEASAKLLQQMAVESIEQAAAVAIILIDCLSNNHKVLIFGNGGSAADAQHFAAELGGRYRMERRALPALALTTDTSMLTAISNDYGFARVFARQVEALAQPGDVVIGISTSGRSANVIAGLQTARALGARTVALLGAEITGLAGVADQVISVPSTDTPRIQEAHAVIIHILCDLVEKSAAHLPIA